VETIGYPLTSRFAVTSPFGWRQHPVNGSSSFHAGIDLAAPLGTPTLAMLSGRVVHAGWEGGYGESVVIEHPGTGLKTRYAHLSRIHVQPGQWVDKGWHIGDSGATGLVTGPHAHIEIMVNGQPVDPWPYLAQSSHQAVLWKRFHVWAG
jgi:murein DD-endopeptidase MepM/ murein hydrolase activator NlpD